MRSVKHEDGHNPALPATHPSRPANLKRRGFLLTLGAGGAGAAAVAVGALPAATLSAATPDSAADDGGYAATAHVQSYYKTAKI